MPAIPISTLEKFTTFGDLLRFLRRRAGITQLELSIAVGYSNAQICRLEQNLRLPDPPTIEARFVPALLLEDEPKVVAKLLELAATVRREDAPEPGLCPYKGLEYFDEADAGLFVGREGLSTKLANRVLSLASSEEANGKRFLTIVGASGSGKSSLVRAGLVPALRWDKRSASWQIHVFTPTAHPLESLAITLSKENNFVSCTESVIGDLQRDPRSLGLFIKQDLKDSGASRLLLVIDQFEELFSLCRSEEERSAFINSLLSVASEDNGQAIIVITLRADFYAHCAGYLKLREALATHQEYIGAMNDEEMLRAIEEPARRGRWEFEGGLVDLILHDVGHEPGALPLLSHALLETWQRRHGRKLTLSGYTSAGGVRGAIAETAEAVFTDQFTHEQQAIARRIFLRLTELGDETAAGDTRRRVTFNELILNPEEREATQAVLNALADARLVTTREDSVEVAHEALIREWPTLRSWLEDNREGLRLHRQLTEAAQDWQSAGCEPDLLFRGVRLAQIKEWAADHAEDMNIQEREFLAASIESSERDIAEREAIRQRELDTARRLVEVESRRAEEECISKNKLRRRAIYLSMALAMTAVLVILAVFFARQATQNADLAYIKQSTADAASTQAINEAFAYATAETMALLQKSTADAARIQAINEAQIRATAEADAKLEADINRSLNLANIAQQVNQAGQVDLAIALAMEAAKISQPPPEALLALRKVAISPGTRFILTGHSQGVQAVAISPDNHLAVSGSCADPDRQGSCLSGELILWDVDAQKDLHRWSAHAGWVKAVAFSLDGQTIISGGDDGVVMVWDASTGKELRKLAGHSGSIVNLVVTTSPVTGNVALLSGSTDGALILWDLQSGSILQRFGEFSRTLTCFAVAPDEPRVVSGYADGSLILWDLMNAQSIEEIDLSGDPVSGVSMSPDASYILSTAGLTLRKIDSQSGIVLNEYSTGGISGHVYINPDGKSAFVGIGGDIMQVNTEDLRRIQSFHVSIDIEEFGALNISQDGRLGITGYTNGSLRVWNLIEALDYQIFKTGLLFPDALSVNPDNNLLLLGDASGTIQSPVLWNISEAKIVKAFAGFKTKISPESVAISPDNRFAVAGGGDIYTNTPELIVWNVESGEINCYLDGEIRSIVRSLAFSPDGRSLLVGTQTNGPEGVELKQDLILWDIQSCQIVRRFEMNEKEDVTGIAFSSDGKLVATGTAYNKRVILWDVSTGREVHRFFVPLNSGFLPIFDVAFGPGNTTILAPGLGTIYLWDVDTGKIIRQYTGSADMIWSLDVSPDGKYILSGSNNGELILWDFATGEELYRLPAHTMPILSVHFSSDGVYAYAISTDGILSKWRITTQSLPELLYWIHANRYVRELTCEERQRYRVEPLCESENP